MKNTVVSTLKMANGSQTNSAEESATLFLDTFVPKDNDQGIID